VQREGEAADEREGAISSLLVNTIHSIRQRGSCRKQQQQKYTSKIALLRNAFFPKTLQYVQK